MHEHNDGRECIHVEHIITVTNTITVTTLIAF